MQSYLVELCQVCPVYCLIPEHTVNTEVLGGPARMSYITASTSEHDTNTAIGDNRACRVLQSSIDTPARAATATRMPGTGYDSEWKECL